MKLKRWEICLLLAFAVTLLSATLISGVQPALSEKIIRLHVLANSDSDGDQALKLLVRDAVLETAGDLTADADGAAQAEAILRENLNVLEAAANDVSLTEGYSSDVTLERAYFPTREYDTFSLPAGEYTSLRVTVGAGEGHNWWCVLFPQLCTGGTDFVKAGLTQDETDLITRSGARYQVKFKIIELWEALRQRLS